MIQLRPFAGLGGFRNEWLNARHHFSFGSYHYYKMSRPVADQPKAGWFQAVVKNPAAAFSLTSLRPMRMELLRLVRTAWAAFSSMPMCSSA